jgi:polyvinyl alcohol dehydrogenase (cytochrome)
MEPFPLPGPIELAHRTVGTVRRLHYHAFKNSVIWDYGTAHDYTAVNGVPAKGGALDYPGPVVAGSMLYVASGYGSYGGLPDKVLLAFSVDDQ